MPRDADFRRETFEQIRDAKTKEEAQQIALRLWHDMNATQEGFICIGCANCVIVEDAVAERHPPGPSLER